MLLYQNLMVTAKWKSTIDFVDFQSPSHVQLFATPLTAARQASLSFTVSQSLLKFMSVEVDGNAIQP